MNDLRNRLIVFAAGVLLVAGCGRSGPPTMDVTAARAAVAAALDAWKAGEPAEQLRQRTPAVDFRDLHWDRGARLERYEVEAAQPSGFSAQITVKLFLTDRAGKSRPRVVVYTVDAGPTIVVRPEMM
ncbi:MAG: lipoprotein [Gemmataceae bacterium]